MKKLAEMPDAQFFTTVNPTLLENKTAEENEPEEETRPEKPEEK